MEEEARAELEAQLIALYGEGESEEKETRRKLLFNDDGSINPFQRLGLKRSLDQRDSAPSPSPPTDQTPIPTPPPDLAADIPEPVPGYDDRVDLKASIKQRLRIVDAVRTWGKEQGAIRAGSKRDGNMIRCPFPHHVDNRPSAWFNTDGDLWNCAVCQVGGDQIDFYAAAVHGLAPADFHHDKEEFREVLEELAVLLGIDLDPPVLPVDRSDPPEPDPDRQFEEVIEGISDDDPLDWAVSDSHDPLKVSKKIPTYREWRNLLPRRGTFWHEWVAFHEEYYGWLAPEYSVMTGAMLIGLACGHHQYAENGTEKTTGAMMLTLVALSTIGKTTVQKRIEHLLRDASGARWDPESGTGLHVLPYVPGSAEALMEGIRHEHEAVPGDPSSMTESRVTTLWIVRELNSFMAKSKFRGTANNYRDVLIELRDFSKRFPDEMEQVVASGSKTHAKVAVHDAFFSVLFATQTDMVRRNFTDDDIASGFANRLIPVFGERLRRRSLRHLSAPVPAPYVKCFEDLLERVRSKPLLSMLRISAEAIDFLESDPYAVMLEDYGQHAGYAVIARLNQHMHQIAFFLAADEDRAEVDLSCYMRALHLTRYYLEPCFAAFYTAAKATELKDLADKIVNFIQNYFERTNRWPEWRVLGQQTFWRNADAQECKRAWEGLRDSHQLARLKVQADGARGAGVATAVLTMESPWTQFAGLWDKRESEKVLYHET